MKLELQTTVSVEELVKQILSAIRHRSMNYQDFGQGETAFYFITEMASQFDDDHLYAELAEYFIKQSVICGIIENKEELNALVEEHYELFNNSK